MFRYIIRRIIFFIPVLIGVSLIIFFISKNQPSSPIDAMCARDGVQACDSIDRERIAQKLYLDQPVFYWTLTTQAFPEDLYKIHNTNKRNTLKRLFYLSGNQNAVWTYYQSLEDFEWKVFNTKMDSITSPIISKLKSEVGQLLYLYKPKEITPIFKRLKKRFGTHTDLPLYGKLAQIEKNYKTLTTQKNTTNKYMPAFYWHGFKNQYHTWCGNLLRLELGESYHEGYVAQKIKDNINLTVIISVISIILAYVIAIFLGVVAATKKDARTDRWISNSLYALYSLPNFWIAMLFIAFLTNKDWMIWFPAGGLTTPGIPYSLLDEVHHLILPIYLLDLSCVGFLSQQMRN